LDYSTVATEELRKHRSELLSGGWASPPSGSEMGGGPMGRSCTVEVPAIADRMALALAADQGRLVVQGQVIRSARITPGFRLLADVPLKLVAKALSTEAGELAIWWPERIALEADTRRPVARAVWRSNVLCEIFVQPRFLEVVERRVLAMWAEAQQEEGNNDMDVSALVHSTPRRRYNQARHVKLNVLPLSAEMCRDIDELSKFWEENHQQKGQQRSTAQSGKKGGFQPGFKGGVDRSSMGKDGGWTHNGQYGKNRFGKGGKGKHFDSGFTNYGRKGYKGKGFDDGSKFGANMKGNVGNVNGMNGMSGMGGMSGMSGTNGMNGMDGMSGMSGLGGMNGMGGTSGMGGMNGIGGMGSMNDMNGSGGETGGANAKGSQRQSLGGGVAHAGAANDEAINWLEMDLEGARGDFVEDDGEPWLEVTAGRRRGGPHRAGGPGVSFGPLARGRGRGPRGGLFDGPTGMRGQATQGGQSRRLPPWW